ncbi:Ubiquinone biosynthesis O-methyltransferase [Stieleria neptunia]|uniref:Ubiquinone biosynthesis O-methyltransferase n=1 Tax=Stieleria neptunia TaxID=2527979 RepID=A0A518HNH0_9BACT|nr:class I SAM-dependent methyltransferase [Stieleria neptunia]QDV42391.1 Ubiquinone biosynthesis O-methyltransferase [Stieleria neptunia]
MSQNVPQREHFQQAYDGRAPWDIGKPQPVFVEAAEQVTGRLLDVGCGTGENSLFFAARGHPTTGIDFLEHPIAEANRKARERGLPATFMVMDALRLDELGEDFDSAIDCGLFHVFSDPDRARYVDALESVVKPGGRLFLMCFSDLEPPGDGPRRITRDEIHAAFATDWHVESIRQVRFETRRDPQQSPFSEGGPFAWFSVICRTGSSPGGTIADVKG